MGNKQIGISPDDVCDSLGDYFDHKSLRRLVNNFYKKAFSDTDDITHEYAGKIGEILGSDTLYKTFLMDIWERKRLVNKLTSQQMTCFVLSSEEAGELISATPCSVDRIMYLDIVNIYEKSRHDRWIVTEEEKQINFYDATYILIDMEFPVFDIDLRRVFFESDVEGRKDIIRVSLKTGELIYMNKAGYITNEEGALIETQKNKKVPLSNKEALKEAKQRWYKGTKEIPRKILLSKKKKIKKDSEKKAELQLVKAEKSGEEKK